MTFSLLGLVIRWTFALTLIAALLLLTVLVGRSDLRPRTVYASPTATPAPPDVCPPTGAAFETTISQMPIANPTQHPIEAMCPRGGRNDGNNDRVAQNAAKNNFLTYGLPIAVTFADFSGLQALHSR